MRSTFGPMALSLGLFFGVAAHAQAPSGEIKGSAWQHTPASLQASVAQAQVALPARLTGGQPYFGKYAALPAGLQGKAPVVLFLHGSSGLGLAAIGQWQQWLASFGIASIAPDSFALPDRATYKSPIDKASYEKMHALRASEIAPTLQALRAVPWVDATRIVLAGTSEGSPAVARSTEPFAGRMLFAWSCEDNYFVEAHRTATVPEPVLNVISSTDPFFSRSNAWLGNATAQGHCGEAFKAHKAATIVLVPGAPHTLLMLPQVKVATRAWLEDLLKP